MMNGADETPTTRRRRSGVFARLVIGLVVLVLGASACAGTTVTATGERAEPDDTARSETPESNPTSTSTSAATEAEPAEPAASPEPTPTPHPIAAADTELPAAPIGFENLVEAAPAGPQPVSIAIENINVLDAVVIPVGVNAEDQSFEVPPADQVGWYKFGPAPGEPGSAVLAAHIAFNGVDGVFRYLEDVEIGATVRVGFDDGSTQRYRITDVTEYDKEALPDSVWAREGNEQLALITCGGAFNYELDSYESNTVAIAVPI